MGSGVGYEISDLCAGDHFDGPGVFGTGFDDEGGGFDESVELGAFFEGDGTGAGNLAADVAIDGGGDGGDRVEEFDACAFFDTEIAAFDGADDFSVAADDKIPGAFDGAGEFTEDGEVMAAERGTYDYAGFLDRHIAAGLDQAVPVTSDIIIQQTNIAAAFRALAGLRLGDGGEGVTAIEATNITGRPERIDQALEERARWRIDRADAQQKRRPLGGEFGLGVRILARGGKPRHWLGTDNSPTLADLEIRPTGTALGGNHECGFDLLVPAFRACHLDAMALGLIGHE